MSDKDKAEIESLREDLNKVYQCGLVLEARLEIALKLMSKDLYEIYKEKTAEIQIDLFN